MNLGPFNPIIDLINGALVRRGERSQERHNLELATLQAKATAASQAAEHAASWESIMAAKNSWFDDYWTLLLSIPLIMSFVPVARPFVTQGFDALSYAPEWFIWSVLASISAAFARRNLPSLKGWLNRSAG